MSIASNPRPMKASMNDMTASARFGAVKPSVVIDDPLNSSESSHVMSLIAQYMGTKPSSTRVTQLAARVEQAHRCEPRQHRLRRSGSEMRRVTMP